MKQYFVLLFACMALWGCGGQDQIETPPLKIIDQIDFSHVHIRDNFWSPRLAKHTSATLPVCIDQIENQTGRMQNFENAARGTGKHSGIFFDDSDVYKALEGIAYSLINNPDPELEKKADEWIDKIAAAQQPDGYINTFYTLTGQDKRWNNMDKHEMYCAGHMMEAAVAYYQATGKRKLLDVSIRMADHMMELFGPGKRHWVPGHEEIELALVKIYRTTGQEKYLDFANWLLEERGHGHGSMGGEGKWDPAYYQDVIPVRELTDISGHAVRCMYLYCGMADVAALKKDTAYVEALNRLWDDVVLRNMYVTGGIGSSRHNEGFTEDYDLPNLDAYCETCASVGMVYWNQRMNQFTGDSKYIDGTFHVQRCASWRLTGWRPLLLRQSAGIERRPSPPGLVRVRLLSEPDLALPAFHRELYLWDIGQGLVGKPLHRKHHRSHDRREKGRHETRNGLPLGRAGQADRHLRTTARQGVAHPYPRMVQVIHPVGQREQSRQYDRQGIYRHQGMENRRLDRAQHGHAGRKSISRPARAAKHGQARPATRTAGLLPRRDGQRERLCRPRTDAHLLIRGQRRTGQPGWHPLNQSHIEWTNTTFHSLLCLGQPQSRQDESMDRLSRIT